MEQSAPSVLAPVLQRCSPRQAQALQALRRLVYTVAQELPEVNDISESLKWGQPSFEAVNPKTGSPVRIDVVRGSKTRYALYFICTTSLVEEFRERYGNQLDCEGNRAILFDIGEAFPTQAVKHCIAMALTYKLRKK